MNASFKTVGILLFPQVEELDFVGPWEMLTMWRDWAGGPPSCLLVAPSTEPLTCAKGLVVQAHVSMAEFPPLNVLVVPGGMGTRREVHNPALVSFVARQAAACQHVLSVCTGAFILHAAGLLQGKRATTHWGSLDRLRALGDVEATPARWVRDGQIWTSAGVSAGIDLTLAFIAEVAGDDAAGQVQLAAEYYPDGVRYGSDDRHAQTPRNPSAGQ